MTELTPVVLLGIFITSFGWILHEMHRLRDLIAELQKDVVAIRMFVEHSARNEETFNADMPITRIRIQ